jgi:spore coat polysaccharide biosynthesis predicted glycosyltransferase SpsG/RimJ/RimL family protein N-acetyltransferase
MVELPYTTAYFCPDGAPEHGMGHLYRCRNLAIALRRHMEVAFVVDDAPSQFLTMLEEDGIAWRQRAAATADISDQIVVFDERQYTADHFTAARRRGNIVVALDDSAKAYFNCDLVVSQGPQNQRQQYHASTDCRFLLGCEFALINPCFYAQAHTFRPDVRRLFVGFGGSDPEDVTSFVADALTDINVELDIVVGIGYRHMDRLRQYEGRHVRLHRSLPQPTLAALMAQCDAAIASGGTTSLELTAVGVPALLFAFVEEHLRPCEAFEAQGLAAFGGRIPGQGREATRSAIVEFLAAKARRQAMHAKAHALFHQSGVSRVADEIATIAAARRVTTKAPASISPSVTVVPFNAAHLDQTRRWITDRRVAEPFLFAGQVTPESHRDWFRRATADRTQCLFAVCGGSGRHVGNVGFKNLDRESRCGEMWIYMAPEVHGHGLGSAAVREAVSVGFDQLRLERIYLHVSPGNPAARRIYEKAGFRLAKQAAQAIPFNGQIVHVDRLERLGVDAPLYDEAKPKELRVALMQPMFLPWLGYFELMDAVDIFIFLDDFQFSRQGWGHRNRLFLSPGRPGIVSLPIRHPGSLAATFLDIEPLADERWRTKLARSLSQSYGRSSYFAEIWYEIEPKLRASDTDLASFEIGLIEVMAARLGIRTQLRRSSEFVGVGAGAGRSERLVSLLDAAGAGAYYAARGSADYMREDGVFPLPRLPVFFQDFAPVPYPQPGASAFVSRLSALDALFNLGMAQARDVMHGTRRWLPWDEATAAHAAARSEGEVERSALDAAAAAPANAS